MSEMNPDSHKREPDDFDRIVSAMDTEDTERFNKLNQLDPDNFLDPKPEDMPPVFEVKEPIETYEAWKAKRDRYASHINRIREISARTGDDRIMNTQWYGVLLGKYIIYDQQTRGFEQRQKSD